MNTTQILYVLITVVVLIAVGAPVRAAGRRFQIPPAVSLMALGVLLGASGFDILPAAYRDVSSYLSKSAFVVLLLRAGLGISPEVLRKIALPVIAFGIIPVVAELGVVVAGSRWLFFPDIRMALLAGFLVAAVSPAVILPTMLDQKHKGRGEARHVPDRIIGQTVLNALIAQTGILLLLEVLDPQSGRSMQMSLLLFPVNLFGGVVLGVCAGTLLRLELLLGKPGDDLSPTRAWGAVAGALAMSLVVYFGCSRFGLESVLATLAVGITLGRRLQWCVLELRDLLRRVWSVAEIILFVNLGSVIDVGRLSDVKLVGSLLLLLAVALMCRAMVTRLMAERTSLTHGEKIYVTTAQLPKATIQAVFGSVVYLRLTSAGEAFAAEAQIFLIMAVLAIVATAPVGAVLLDRWGERLLGPSDRDSVQTRQEETRPDYALRRSDPGSPP